jgi:hypothetical protein
VPGVPEVRGGWGFVPGGRSRIVQSRVPGRPGRRNRHMRVGRVTHGDPGTTRRRNVSGLRQQGHGQRMPMDSLDVGRMDPSFWRHKRTGRGRHRNRCGRGSDRATRYVTVSWAGGNQ